MKRNENDDRQNRDDLAHWGEKEVTNNPAGSFHNEMDAAAGNDLDEAEERREEQNDRVRHHQAHGIKRYESFSNRSSADDQPMTDTGA